jgi:hypothetical protein
VELILRREEMQIKILYNDGTTEEKTLPDNIKREDLERKLNPDRTIRTCHNSDACKKCSLGMCGQTIVPMNLVDKIFILDEIKFEDLHIGQKVWFNGEEREIVGLQARGNSGRSIALQCNFSYQNILVSRKYDDYDWRDVCKNISLTPPKKKVIKIVEGWVNIYRWDDGHTRGIMAHATKELADKAGLPNRVDCVRLTGTCEAEE